MGQPGLFLDSERVGQPPAPADWKWSSFRHYALREVGVVEIESEWVS